MKCGFWLLFVGNGFYYWQVSSPTFCLRLHLFPFLCSTPYLPTAMVLANSGYKYINPFSHFSYFPKLGTCFLIATTFKLWTLATGSHTSLYNSLIHHIHFNLMHQTLEMFSSIIHAVGLIRFCIAQSLAMSVSCLISHLTVSDLNTSAAVDLRFLLIYPRQHCNHHHLISDLEWYLTLSIHSDWSMTYCNSTHHCNCCDNSVSENRRECSGHWQWISFFLSVCWHTIFHVLCHDKLH